MEIHSNLFGANPRCLCLVTDQDILQDLLNGYMLSKHKPYYVSVENSSLIYDEHVPVRYNSLPAPDIQPHLYKAKYNNVVILEQTQCHQILNIYPVHG